MDGNGRETFVIYLVLAGEGPMGGGRMQCALSRPSSLIQTLNRVEEKQNSVINRNIYMNKKVSPFSIFVYFFSVEKSNIEYLKFL